MKHISLLVLLLAWWPACHAQDGPPAARPRKNAFGDGPPIAQAKLLNTNDSFVHASNDLMATNKVAHERYRWLSLYNIPESERVRYIQQVSKLVNELSRSRLIKVPVVVPDSNNSLLRIDITDYTFFDDETNKYVGWRAEVWDRLAIRDPYFYSTKYKIDQPVATVITTTQNNSQRLNPDGTPILRTDIIKTQSSSAVGAPSQVLVHDRGVLISKPHYEYVCGETCTWYPIMRADFFLANASLPPFYHDFLDFGDKSEDFVRAALVDYKKLRIARVEINGIVVKSGHGMSGKVIPVSENNRFIARYPSPYGYLWRTKDVEKVKDQTDYLRILHDDAFDASEWIASARNGLQWYFLSNKDEKRQDEAPIAIVRDDTNIDRRVRNGRSCFTCHRRGINEFLPQPQESVKNHIDIVSPLEKANIRLREAFLGNVPQFIQADNRIFEQAVNLATTVYVGGKPNFLDTETAAIQFGVLYNKYAEAPVTLQMASYETGVSVKNLMLIFDQAYNDPYLKNLSRNNPSLAVPRASWERSFQQAMVLIEASGVRR